MERASDRPGDHPHRTWRRMLVIVPRGVEHRTSAEEEAEVLVFEPAATRNTGNVEHATFTVPTGIRI